MNVRNGAFISDSDRCIDKYVDFSCSLKKLSFNCNNGLLYSYEPRHLVRSGSSNFDPVVLDLQSQFLSASDSYDRFFGSAKGSFRDQQYFDNIRDILKDNQIRRARAAEEFISDFSIIDNFVGSKEKDFLCSIQAKIRRFGKKCYMNRDKFSFFITLTRDDKLFSTEDAWKKSILKQFNNLNTRYGVQWLGVFERGDLGGRLHFHAFVVPGSFDFQLKKVRAYSLKDGKWSTYYQSTYFLKRYGRNEFDDISNFSDSDFQSSFRYMVKYCCKQTVCFYYSRHLPSECIGFLSFDDVYFEVQDNCYKYFVNSIDVLQRDNIVPLCKPLIPSCPSFFFP